MDAVVYWYIMYLNHRKVVEAIFAPEDMDQMQWGIISTVLNSGVCPADMYNRPDA